MEREKLPRIKHSQLPQNGVFKIISNPWVTFSQKFGQPEKMFGVIENGIKKVYDSSERKFIEKDISDSIIDKMYNINIKLPNASTFEVYENGTNTTQSLDKVQLILKEAAWKELTQTIMQRGIETGNYNNPINTSIIRYELLHTTFKKGDEEISYYKIKFQDPSPEDKELFVFQEQQSSTTLPQSNDEEDLFD